MVLRQMGQKYFTAKETMNTQKTRHVRRMLCELGQGVENT